MTRIAHHPRAIVVGAIAASILLSACEPAPSVPPVPSVPDDRTAGAARIGDTSGTRATAASWRTLSGAHVWFGHQSVGGNLMEGVQTLLQETPGTGVRVVALDSATPATPTAGAITHFVIGTNGEPATKLAAFAAALDRAGADSGVALMKFCYLDMRADSDPEALLRDYQRTVADVRARHPGLTLVHVTMPVTTVESDARALVKSVMGKVTSRELNRRRERYNALLRQAYAGREPLFDLARHESTGPDGRQHVVRVKGETVPVLADAYSDDGGHLNARGQRVIGAHLVEALASAAGGAR